MKISAFFLMCILLFVFPFGTRSFMCKTILDRVKHQVLFTFPSPSYDPTQFVKHSPLESLHSLSRENFRKTGAEYLESLKIGSKDEAWRFTNVSDIFNTSYVNVDFNPSIDASILSKIKEKISLFPRFSEYRFIFFDGVLVNDISYTNFAPNWLNPLSHGDNCSLFLPDVFEKTPHKFGSDFIAALNLAHFHCGYDLHIPENVVVKSPIEIYHIFSDKNYSARFPFLRVRLDSNTSACIIENILSLEDSSNRSMAASQTKITLETNSSLLHLFFQNLSDSTILFDLKTANLSSNSCYNISIIQLGGNFSRCNLHIYEDGAACKSKIGGLMAADANQTLQMYASSDHNVSQTSSFQYQRNIIGKGGKIIWKGRIRIPGFRQKCLGRQLCRSILLPHDDNSRLVAMPILEVGSDDATCSHGVSVSGLDSSSKFYLSTRGITSEVCDAILLKNFAISEAIDDNLKYRFYEDAIGKKLAILESKSPLAQLAIEHNKDLTATIQSAV